MPPPAVQVFHVSDDQAQQTLLALLRQWLPGQSWSQVRKLLSGRHVQINGNMCLDEGRRLKAKDVIRVLDNPQAQPPRDADVKIRYMDLHIVIVEKPAGMTTLRHAEEQDWPSRRKQVQPTLDEVLPKVIAQQDKTKQPKGKRPPRIRAVHRLDRETSGLMIFARTPEAEQKLVQMFRKHDMHRQYVAIVQGRLEAQTIESDLIRDRGDGKRGSTTLKDAGQHAITHVKPIEYLEGYTVVECKLETGRTHQIRIHLSELGHVLCGEKIYHTPLFQKPIPDHSGASRIALHAAELGLKHPITGEEMLFKMQMPPDMAELLKRLRAQSAKK
ncbi:MAG: RluA family pseudouridine synthase [Planctomycetota bacterium]